MTGFEGRQRRENQDPPKNQLCANTARRTDSGHSGLQTRAPCQLLHTLRVAATTGILTAHIMTSEEPPTLGFNGGYIPMPPLPPKGKTESQSSEAWDGSACGSVSEATVSPAFLGAKRAKTWHIPMSLKAQRTTNPIRGIMEKLTSQKRDPIPGKELIPLSLGDPTAHGNLQAPKVLNDKMIQLICRATSNGYGVRAHCCMPAKYHLGCILSA